MNINNSQQESNLKNEEPRNKKYYTKKDGLWGEAPKSINTSAKAEGNTDNKFTWTGSPATQFGEAKTNIDGLMSEKDKDILNKYKINNVSKGDTTMNKEDPCADKKLDIFVNYIGYISKLVVAFYMNVKKHGLTGDEALGLTNIFMEFLTKILP